ncbi:MAG: hypothetical protein QOD83_1919 [Solirubrobacteraceae bacterium]|nr:hypothetical protein [Solirubrobacteraceae bacterium]
MARIALYAALFTVIVGGVMAWYAFRTPKGIPGTMAVTAYIDPEAPAKAGCVRHLTLVVTVLNTVATPATITAVRFLAGKSTSLDAHLSPRRIGGDKQVVLRFDVGAVYARLRAHRVGRSITRVEVHDGAGIRYRSPVALNSDARICGR